MTHFRVHYRAFFKDGNQIRAYVEVEGKTELEAADKAREKVARTRIGVQKVDVEKCERAF